MGTLKKRGGTGTSRPSFIEWIDTIGISALAGHLKIHPMTVRYWRVGRCYPKIDHMRLIKIFSKGLVGYEQIIDQHVLAPRDSRVRGSRALSARAVEAAR